MLQKNEARSAASRRTQGESEEFAVEEGAALAVRWRPSAQPVGPVSREAFVTAIERPGSTTYTGRCEREGWTSQFWGKASFAVEFLTRRFD